LETAENGHPLSQDTTKIRTAKRIKQGIIFKQMNAACCVDLYRLKPSPASLFQLAVVEANSNGKWG